MALKLKGSTSGFVAIDAPSVAGNNTLILPENTGSAQQLLGNDITAGVVTFTSVTVNRNGDLTVPGTISIGGTLTYEDVTSVDSVGIVTARSGVRVNGGGLTIIGDTTGLKATGISTFVDVSARNVTVTGVTTFSNNANFGANGLISGSANFSLSSNKLRVTGSDTVGIECQRSANATIQCTETTNSTDLQLRANATGGLVRTATNKPLVLGTYQQERVRITEVGQVLVGLSTVSNTQMVIYGDGTTDNKPAIVFQNNSTGTGTGQGFYVGGNSGADSQGYVWNYENDSVIFATNNSERIEIIGSGEVSIGGFTPTAGDGILQLNGGLRIAGSASASDTTSPYIYRTSGVDDLNFATSGVERMKISSTGTIDLNVAGLEADIYSTGSGTQYSLRLLNSDATAGNRIGMYFGPANNVAGAYIRGHASEDFTSTANRDCGLEFGVRHNGTFYEALDINSMGQQDNLSITNAGTHFTFRNTTTSNTGTLLKVTSSRNTTNGSYYLAQWGSTSADRFTVLDSGNCANTNNSFSAISDQALKENIVDAGSQWDDIKNLKVRKFNFIETTDPDKKTMLGVVAQEAETVCPNLVETISTKQNGEEKEVKSFKYSILYMKSVKALQEAMARIETLESEVAALKGS